jgi:general secretion pathway protein N
MKRLIGWTLAGITTIAFMIMAFFPASWVASALESQTKGKLTIADAKGSIWRGSGFIGVAPSGDDPLTPVLPGRFSWSISPLVLFGYIDARLENRDALSQPIQIGGNWFEFDISPSSISFPAERLAGLGAPFNTIGPSGKMQLRWDQMHLTNRVRAVELVGSMTLQMKDMSSRLSPVKPLGGYQLRADWSGTQAQLRLTTEAGPLQLDGTGSLTNGRLQFSGKAFADTGMEERLRNLLYLLGQPRNEGGKSYIALEIT